MIGRKDGKDRKLQNREIQNHRIQNTPRVRSRKLLALLAAGAILLGSLSLEGAAVPALAGDRYDRPAAVLLEDGSYDSEAAIAYGAEADGVTAAVSEDTNDPQSAGNAAQSAAENTADDQQHATENMADDQQHAKNGDAENGNVENGTESGGVAETAESSSTAADTEEETQTYTAANENTAGETVLIAEETLLEEDETAGIDPMASDPVGGYSVWDSVYNRKATDSAGNTSSDWTICMNSNKGSPGSSSGGTSGYQKIDFADNSTYLANRTGSSNANFQKIKRLLYYRLTHPNVNYAVLQNEYYYQETGQSNSYYNTTWSEAWMNTQKMEIRAAANDSSLDEMINERMVVTIYHYNGSYYQNTISARMEAVNVPVIKVWHNNSGQALPESVTIRLTEASGTLHIPNNTLVLNADNNWTASFTNLPRYVGLNSGNPTLASYSISEDAVEGFTTVIEGHWTKGWSVINTSKDNAPELGSLTVSKSVTGSMGQKDRRFGIHVTFGRGNLTAADMTQPIEYTYGGETRTITPEALLGLVDGKQISDDAYSAVTVDLALADNESVTFTNVPYGVTYSVTEDDYTGTGDGYERPVYRVDGADLADAGTEWMSVTGTIDAESRSIRVINRRNEIINTGLESRSMLHIVLLALITALSLAASGFLLLTSGHRR